MTRLRNGLALFTICLALQLGSPASLADIVSDFFTGKTITYVTSYRPGGGYEIYTRLITRHLEKHLPETALVLKNAGGAGGTIAANKIYRAEPDGLTIGGFNTGLMYSQLLGRDGVMFDLRDMSWIGKATSDPRVLVIGRKSGYRSIEDVMNSPRQLVLAVGRITSSGYQELTVLSKILGLDAKIVPNFRTPERMLGIFNGDFDGTFGSYSSLRPLVADKHGFFAVQFGAREGGPGWGIPSARNFVDNELDRSVLSLMERVSSLGRLSVAPPGVPADRLAVLRKAYLEALQDPGLIEEAARLKVSISPADGEAVAKVVASILNPPVEAFRRFAELVGLPIGSLDLRVRLDEIDETGSTISFSTGEGPHSVYALDDSAAVSLNGQPTRLAKLAVGDRCDVDLRIGNVVEVVELTCLR